MTAFSAEADLWQDFGIWVADPAFGVRPTCIHPSWALRLTNQFVHGSPIILVFTECVSPRCAGPLKMRLSNRTQTSNGVLWDVAFNLNWTKTKIVGTGVSLRVAFDALCLLLDQIELVKTAFCLGNGGRRGHTASPTGHLWTQYEPHWGGVAQQLGAKWGQSPLSNVEQVEMSDILQTVLLELQLSDAADRYADAFNGYGNGTVSKAKLDAARGAWNEAVSEYEKRMKDLEDPVAAARVQQVLDEYRKKFADKK